MEIIEGVIHRPVLVAIYGPPGVGKTSLASTFGRTIFLDAENGTDFLPVKRVRATAWQNVVTFMTEVAEHRADFDTVVFDSLTAIEKLATTDVLKTKAWPTLATPKFGEGYAELKKRMQRLVDGMGFLRNAGFNCVLLAHAKTRTVNEPSQDPHDRTEFECQSNCVNMINSAMDAAFYFRPKVTSSEGRTFGVGVRELIMSDKGGALAKTRFKVKGTREFNNENEYEQFWKGLLENV